MEEQRDRGDGHGSKFNDRSKGQQIGKGQGAKVKESGDNNS